MSVDMQSLLVTLKKYFGFDSLRESQVPIITSVMEGKDSLSILKTSGGKTLCYQLPTLHRNGLSLVVSPLISLMKDQVDALVCMGIPAAYVNSSLSLDEVRDRYARLGRGEYRLFYVAPERFQDNAFIDALCAADLRMFAIDEAHCASQWGHNFRPHYARLGQSMNLVERELGREVQRVAFTATATARVQEDIVAILGLRNPDVHLQDFDRENLIYAVIAGDKDRSKDVENIIRENTGSSGIVYCVTVKEVERLYHHLLAAGIKVGRYHGKLDAEEKNRIQDEFLSDHIQVLVSTSAFGMGIDKPNIRFVIHAQMPGSLEAYVQEAGRAGRDGLTSKAILLYSPSDRGIHQFFIGMGSPDPKAIRAVKDLVYRSLVSGPEELSSGWLASICREPISQAQVTAVLNLLVGQGELQRRESVYSLGDWNPNESYLWVDEIRRNDWQKVNAMQAWCETTLCRRWSVLKYFGRREAHKRCGSCDTCLSEVFSKDKATGSQPYIRPITLINLAQSLDRLAKAGTVYWKQVLLGMMPTSSLSDAEVEVAGRFTNYAVGDLERWSDLLKREVLLDGLHNLTSRGNEWIQGKISLSLHENNPHAEDVLEISPHTMAALKRWRKMTAYQEDIAESAIATEARLQKLALLKEPSDQTLMDAGFSQVWVKRHGTSVLKVLSAQIESEPTP